MKPGIYPDLSNEAYHAAPGLSSSQIKPLLETVDDFLHERDNFDHDRECLEQGTILHEAILTPGALENQYQFYTKHKTRCKTYWSTANKGGFIGLFERDVELVSGVRRQLLKHPRVMGGILEGGKREVSFFAEINGQLLKARTDYIVDLGDEIMILDIKSVRKGHAKPRRFQRAIADFKYDLSAALYIDVVEANLGKPVTHYLFLAIEKEAPFKLKFYRLTEDSIQLGREDYQHALSVYQRWQDGEIEHTGYKPTIDDISLPEWRFNQIR